MALSAERRKWLADRLRKIADEDAAVNQQIAAEFLRTAEEVESGEPLGEGADDSDD